MIHRFSSDTSFNISNINLEKLYKLGHRSNIVSAFIYTEKALEYNKKYNKEYDYNEALITKGLLNSKFKKYNLYHKDSINLYNQYFIATIPFWEKTKNFSYVSLMYLNVSRNFVTINDFENALKYNDSSYFYYDQINYYYKLHLPDKRSDLLEKMHQYDSALYYLKIGVRDYEDFLVKDDKYKTKLLEEKYQNDRKMIMIENRNKLLLLFLLITTIIIISSILIFSKTNKSNFKTKRLFNRMKSYKNY